MDSLEARVATLELLKDQLDLHTFLLHSIIQSNDQLRLGIAEQIRLMIQNPASTHPISESLRDQLRYFRDDLLRPPLADLVAVVTQPPVRPA